MYRLMDYFEKIMVYILKNKETFFIDFYTWYWYRKIIKAKKYNDIVFNRTHVNDMRAKYKPIYVTNFKFFR